MAVGALTVIPPPKHRSALMQASRKRFQFRAGFGPQGQLVYAGSAESDARVTVARLRGETSGRAATEALLLHKAHFWDARDAGTTEAVLADSFVKQNAQAEALGEEERSCWRLADALWGAVEENGDPNPHREGVVRRRLLSEWLEQAAAAAVDREVAAAGDSVPGRVLALLSGHRVKEAVEECIRHRHLRLARIGRADRHLDGVALGIGLGPGRDPGRVGRLDPVGRFGPARG